jgi:hypothetical protein
MSRCPAGERDSIGAVARINHRIARGFDPFRDSLSPASSRLSATARHFSRHLRMNALRFASTCGFESA